MHKFSRSFASWSASLGEQQTRVDATWDETFRGNSYPLGGINVLGGTRGTTETEGYAGFKLKSRSSETTDSQPIPIA